MIFAPSHLTGPEAGAGREAQGGGREQGAEGGEEKDGKGARTGRRKITGKQQFLDRAERSRDRKQGAESRREAQGTGKGRGRGRGKGRGRGRGKGKERKSKGRHCRVSEERGEGSGVSGVTARVDRIERGVEEEEREGRGEREFFQIEVAFDTPREGMGGLRGRKPKVGPTIGR